MNGTVGTGPGMITISAPEGIGEVSPATDLVAVIADAVQAAGGFADGDLLVVTSKIISKHEGRTFPAADRATLITAETVRSVARRRSMAIVETPHGLVQAAAGVDNSNVDPGLVLGLPVDPDASAERLRAGLAERTGCRLGVIVSDTAGRAWRLGQTDHAIGAAGVRVLDSYDGRADRYGNALHVTVMAIGDELAAAADLVKRKLADRPVALIRGLAEFVTGHPDQSDRPGASDGGGARALLRPGPEDLFAMGVREAVLHALLTALGRSEEYEILARLEDPAEVRGSVLGPIAADDPRRGLVEAMLTEALRADPVF